MSYKKWIFLCAVSSAGYAVQGEEGKAPNDVEIPQEQIPMGDVEEQKKGRVKWGSAPLLEQDRLPREFYQSEGASPNQSQISIAEVQKEGLDHQSEAGTIFPEEGLEEGGRSVHVSSLNSPSGSHPGSVGELPEEKGSGESGGVHEESFLADLPEGHKDLRGQPEASALITDIKKEEKKPTHVKSRSNHLLEQKKSGLQFLQSVGVSPNESQISLEGGQAGEKKDLGGNQGGEDPVSVLDISKEELDPFGLDGMASPKAKGASVISLDFPEEELAPSKSDLEKSVVQQEKGASAISLDFSEEEPAPSKSDLEEPAALKGQKISRKEKAEALKKRVEALGGFKTLLDQILTHLNATSLKLDAPLKRDERP